MADDIQLAGYYPQVLIPDNKPDVAIIHLEKVDQTPEGPQRSGRYIHLAVTAQDAMRLLTVLQNVQKEQGWPDCPHRPTVTHVPPEQDRH